MWGGSVKKKSQAVKTGKKDPTNKENPDRRREYLKPCFFTKVQEISFHIKQATKPPYDLRKLY